MKISYLLHVNQHKTMFSKVQTAYPTMKKNCLLMKLRINALIATFISFKFLMIVCDNQLPRRPMMILDIKIGLVRMMSLNNGLNYL